MISIMAMTVITSITARNAMTSWLLERKYWEQQVNTVADDVYLNFLQWDALQNLFSIWMM
jgi:hydroxymethylpyrimidine/phosphomethylpyrimidine kinase